MARPLIESFRFYYTNYQNPDFKTRNHAAEEYFASVTEWVKSNLVNLGIPNDEDLIQDVIHEWIRDIQISLGSDASCEKYQAWLEPTDEHNSRLYKYLTAFLRSVKKRTNDRIFTEKHKLLIVIKALMQKKSKKGEVIISEYQGQEMYSRFPDASALEKEEISESRFPNLVLIKKEENIDHTRLEEYIDSILDLPENPGFPLSVLAEIISQHSDLAFSEISINEIYSSADQDNDGLEYGSYLSDGSPDANPENRTILNDLGEIWFSELTRCWSDKERLRNICAILYFKLMENMTLEELENILNPPVKKSRIAELFKTTLQRLKALSPDVGYEEAQSGLIRLCMIIDNKFGFSDQRIL